MPSSGPDPDRLIETFRTRKVLTREEMIASGGSCWSTAQRILKRHGYLSSYNRNARYYALLETAEFDENGLWSRGEARFSRHGNVLDTIVALVERSDKGLRQRELGDLLEVAVGPRLWELSQQERLQREKVGRSYVYASVRPQKARRQLEARREAQKQMTLRKLPDRKHTVAVLVEMLSGESRRPRNVARRLHRRGVEVSAAQVRKIVEYYELDVSKKKRRNANPESAPAAGGPDAASSAASLPPAERLPT